LAKSIAAADPAAFNLEGLEDELNSIHKVLYPNMWNDEKEKSSISDEQAMIAAGLGAPQKKTKCPNCGKWHRGQCHGKNYKPGNSNTNTSKPNDDRHYTHLEHKCWKKKKGLPKTGTSGEAVNACYEIYLTCTEITLGVAMTTEELQTLEREETLANTGPFLIENIPDPGTDVSLPREDYSLDDSSYDSYVDSSVWNPQDHWDDDIESEASPEWTVPLEDKKWARVSPW